MPQASDDNLNTNIALGRRLVSVLGTLIPLALVSCQAALLVLFKFRWDAASALTVVPFWAYGAAGLLAAAAGAVVFRGPLAMAALLIWLVTLVTCPDEAIGLVRFWRAAPAEGTPAPVAGEGRPLRVVTLNCRRHDFRNLELIKKWQPDVVLLQEAPFRQQLSKLAADLYGKDGGDIASPSWDCAIVARGKITLRKTPHYFTQARVDLPDGHSVEVVSLHLRGAETRLSLHRKSTWQLHARSRRARMKEMTDVQRSILRHAPGQPCILGGDFNSPAGDRVGFALRGIYLDSFRTAGTGWGNTVMNAYPVHRIDQIWASAAALRPVRSVAVPTEHSDHRMLVSDLVWKRP